ncbi:LegC family aminotransferase [Akkermansiaceae bacterium]|nr:LegC family aminotransferase [Akkermansiaceae bacterium]MDB4424347.1 LegC family aminotransferase [Akkermansiaceae bacterium]MDB4600495.1 LegC family aminotransferase [Akkermansiaceae bacterium]
MDAKAEILCDTVRQVLKPFEGFTPMHIPIFDEREVEFLRECVESNFVSSVGAFCDRFETVLGDFTGAKRVILTVNGTSALHLSLLLAGVEPDEEVLIPSFTFVATANAVRYIGAIPHFVEIEEQSLGVDITKLSQWLETTTEAREEGLWNKSTGRRIRCLVPMHTFGHAVNMDELNAVAARFGLVVVEDAAESLGSYYRDRHTGSDSLCAAISFNGNKIITTGGGGAILTNDDDLADRAKHLSTTAKIPHSWEMRHDAVGYNYRMPALNAALGCAQMEKLPIFVEKKRALAERYQRAFDGVEGVRFLNEPEWATSNYWLNTLVLDDDSGEIQHQFLKLANREGIMSRPAWTPLHLLPLFYDCPKMDLTVTETMARRVVNIPSTASL